MTSTIEQQCPLCSRNSQYEFRDHRILKYFLCHTCNEFMISIDAEKRLLKSISQWRTAFSDRAKLSDKENIFVITLASPALKQEGIAYPAISGEFIPRTEFIR